MSEITPKWTMKPAAADKFTVVFYCPFCDEEQTFDLSQHNIQVGHINHWVARQLRDHVLRNCENEPQTILVHAHYDDDDWDTRVLLIPASRAGRNLLKDAGGYLYHLPNEELLAMATGLENDAAALFNRAQELRNLI